MSSVLDVRLCQVYLTLNMEADVMADVDENLPATPKLGLRFWVLWWGALAIVTAGFVAALSVLIRNGLWSSWTGMLTTGAFAVAITALASTPALVALRRNLGPKMRGPHRRYSMRFLPAMLVYSLILAPAITFYQDTKPEGVLAWVVAIAPAAPLLFAIRALMLYYKEEDDEFLKAMAVQSHLLATGFMMAICTTYGFLDMFDLVPHVDLWAVFPLWALCLVPAQAITMKKFR
jgi:hypothetical protein